VVLDPFGGVALGGLDAMRQGLHYIGVELEEKFVDLGNQNIELWNSRYAPHFPTWGTATLLQGDSRQLAKVLGGADGLISSPPYAESRIDGNGDEGSSGLRNPDGSYLRGPEGWQKRREMGERYGSTPGQLGAMRADGFDAAVSADGVVSSPGYGGSEISDNRKVINSTIQGDRNGDRRGGSMASLVGAYSTSGNICANNGSDFWLAARAIVDQVYAVLKPGGCAIWVTKRFIKDKAIVDFSKQWETMCNAAGFETIHWHKAWLVEEKGTQLDLSGNHHKKVTKRYSFFRRLHSQKYPELEIQWEDVICMRRPDVV